MPARKSPTLPAQSHLSREDIELLAAIKGGQEALIKQVNTMQSSLMAESESRRQQMDEQRNAHNEQLKVLKTQMEALELWRITTITTARVEKWDAAADDMSNLKQQWKGVATAWGVIVTALSIGGGWLIANVIAPLLNGGK